MPLAVIYSQPGSFTESEVKSIARALTGIIAQTMSIAGHPHATLTEEDTEVRIEKYGLTNNLHAPQLAIQIFANDYPERRENLEERNAKIVELLKKTGLFPERDLGQNSFYVWTMLFPGAFNTF